MDKLVAVSILVVVLLGPVRLVSWWFKAPHQGWWRSFLVMLIGAVATSLAGSMLPESLITATPARFAVVTLIFCVTGMVILELKAWQAGLLAVLICTIYNFSMSPSGVIGFGVSVGG